MDREGKEVSNGPISGEKEGDFEENEVGEVGGIGWWPYHRRRVHGHWPGVLSCLAGVVSIVSGRSSRTAKVGQNLLIYWP